MEALGKLRASNVSLEELGIIFFRPLNGRQQGLPQNKGGIDMSKYILGQVFLDRADVETASKSLTMGVFGAVESEDEWNEFARSTARKVLLIASIPVALAAAAAHIVWEVVKTPIRIFALVVKELGELYLTVTNPFVLYKDEEKEASE